MTTLIFAADDLSDLSLKLLNWCLWLVYDAALCQQGRAAINNKMITTVSPCDLVSGRAGRGTNWCYYNVLRRTQALLQVSSNSIITRLLRAAWRACGY